MLVFLLFAAATIQLGTAANLTDCYYFNDVVSPNNTVCSGSSACCGPTATCTSERLCHNQGDPADVFIRGPCALSTWDLDSCPQICRYTERNGVFPRVKQCSDQSWCCSDKTGSDVAADIAVCCANGQGVFLDSRGVVVDNATSTSTATSTEGSTSTTVLTSSNTTSTTASAAATTDGNSGSSDGSLSTGAKAGIGVGAAIGGILLLAALAALWTKLRNRRRADAAHGEKSAEAAMNSQDQGSTAWSRDQESYSEAYGAPDRKTPMPQNPSELHSYAPIQELDGQTQDGPHELSGNAPR